MKIKKIKNKIKREACTKKNNKQYKNYKVKYI